VSRARLLLSSLALVAGCSFSPEERTGPSGPPVAAITPEANPVGVPPAIGEAGTDLNVLRSYAITASPEVEAAERATLVALARARQAGLFPNPVLSYAFSDLPYVAGSKSARTLKQVIGISQAFPLGNRIAAAEREAAAEAEVAASHLRVARTELLVRLDEAYAHFLEARESRRLAFEQWERVKEFEQATSARVAAGAIPESELLEVQVDSEKARLEADAANRSLAAAEVALKTTMGKPIAPEILAKGELPHGGTELDTEALVQKANEKAPTLELLERQGNVARASLERAKAERFPDVTVFLAGGYAGGINEPVAEGGVAIPLPIFNRNQYQVEAAKREVERLERTIAGERLSTTVSAVRLARDYEVARTRVTGYHEKIIPAAKEFLAKAREAFAAGKIRDRDVLAAHRALIAAEQAEVSARLDLALAIAGIERLIGEGVPRKK
jgi:cobalt-zinc-cadmium efflux system outer membrane protein